MATRLEHSNEQEWLEQRRNVITATDIARIASGASGARQVRAEKDTGESMFYGNKYTEYGKAQEPFIATYVKQHVDSRLEPNGDLWVSDDDPRFAATPDMVDASGEVVGEIKTVLHTNDWGDGAIPKRYYDQVQWQILIMDAEACVFAWQPYEESNGMMWPMGQPKSRIIRRDNKRIAQLVDMAEAFLDGEDGLSDKPPVEELMAERIRIDGYIKELEAEKKRITGQIAEVVGDEPQSWSFEGLGTVTVVGATTRHTFDQKTFKKDHPDLVDQYTREQQTKPSLRITAEKKEA